MLYYICALHTFWTLVVYAIHWPCAAAAAEGADEGPTSTARGRLRRRVCGRLGGLSLRARYAIAFGLTAVVWHVPVLFYAVFWPVKPLMLLDGSMYEVRSRRCFDWARRCTGGFPLVL
jgi:hypothetical protein